MGEDAVAEVRAALGGQFERESHGILDLGWRHGATSVELLTDTFDARTGRRWARGRAEVGVRFATFAAGLWITPWTAGAPDPSRAQRASYVGPDVRVERWFGGGGYVAAVGFARHHWFVPLGEATLDVADRPWLGGDAIVGWWRPEAEAAVRIGADATAAPGDPRLSPHAAVSLRMDPPGRAAPFARASAVWAANADDVLATRVGGMTPYHVPLAGAAWAEWWVEDLAAVELGLRVRPADVLSLAAFVDAVAGTAPTDTAIPGDRFGAVGIGARAAVERRGWFVEAAMGVAPGIRPEGAPGVSVFALGGSRWRPVRR